MFEVLKLCLLNDLDINYGRLTLCDLRHYRYSNVKTNRKYQVHCENSKYLFSKIYYDIDEAIAKFLELKSKITK